MILCFHRVGFVHTQRKNNALEACDDVARDTILKSIPVF